jgi:tetratricopeptide (TPR) repeat protein
MTAAISICGNCRKLRSRKMAFMSLNRRRHFRSIGPVSIGLALLIPASVLYARGGAWLGAGLATREGLGGYRPPAGVPFYGGWGYGGYYGGRGIPHHSLDGANSGYRSAPLTGYSNRQFPTIDRSVEFPGASSNTSTLLPSFQRDVPAQPYSTGKKFDPPYFHNYDGYWHHGYWGGGQWGWGRWGGDAGIWSVGRWWLSGVYLTSGYGSYRNPFATVQTPPPPSYLDYTRPLENIADDEVKDTSSSAAEKPDAAGNAGGGESLEEIRSYVLKSPEAKAGLKAFDAAADAFQAGQYDQALKLIDEALVQLPYDPALHEFRGLVFFARKDYQQAAAIVYSVLSVSPGWDWTTLSSRYADHEVFSRQLRSLEAYHKQHPESAAAAFLRAYHYTTCRHTEAAVKQFERTVKLLPEDRFLPQLLSLVAGGLEKPSADRVGTEPESPTENASESDVTATAKLVGDFRSQPRKSTTIDLRLEKDQRFLWTATQGGAPRVIAGRYTIEGDVLFLAGGSATLIGRVKMQSAGGFKFSLPGNEHSDPGLEFRVNSGR